jgi:hypothetical protein
MTEIHETIEKAQEGEHSQYFNRRIALLIAVLALFLSFSETLGKSAQTEAIAANVESSDLWAFFQAKSIRMTQINTAAEEMLVAAEAASDPAAKATMQKQIDAWKKTAARYDSEPSTREGRKELAERAKEASRHRAVVGGGDHRHGGARLVWRGAWRDRPCAHGVRTFCPACAAARRDVVDARHSSLRGA